MDFLQLQAPPQKQAHDEAAEGNRHWIGVSPAIKHHAHYIDFIMAQIKTLSSMAYERLNPWFANMERLFLHSVFAC
ncbi:hypothetical protein FRC11_006881 [Ceratobasidium sp. 423]|nr:hypothetical protein FRC11_006881 [Ceratobasidium sp. 423]